MRDFVTAIHVIICVYRGVLMNLLCSAQLFCHFETPSLMNKEIVSNNVLEIAHIFWETVACGSSALKQAPTGISRVLLRGFFSTPLLKFVGSLHPTLIVSFAPTEKMTTVTTCLKSSTSLCHKKRCSNMDQRAIYWKRPLIFFNLPLPTCILRFRNLRETATSTERNPLLQITWLVDSGFFPPLKTVLSSGENFL